MKKIPAEYLNEFLKEKAAFIKKRVKLFCFTAVGFYLFASILSVVIYPGSFRKEEAVLWAILLLGTFAILYLNKKSQSIRIAKLNAYVFTAIILGILTYVNIIYYEHPVYCASIYVFTLFLVSLMIPWVPFEVIIVSLMHLAAYSGCFLYVYTVMASKAKAPFQMQQYYDGLTFIGMAFILCAIIRQKETERDVENFVLLKEVEEKNKQMKKELELATRIHRTLIPKSVSTDLADIAITYLPMYYIGGDYARFHFADKGALTFIISDITGHGVSAALLVNRLHAEFERLVKEGRFPGELLRELDMFIKGDFRDTQMYLSAFCGRLDFKEKKFLYSNYGHPAQYIYRVTESDIRPLGSLTSFLGLPSEDASVYQHELGFAKNDRIFLFTDGVVETRNKRGIEYGTVRLEEFIRENHGLPVEEFNRRLFVELDAYKHKSFKDDISVLSIAIK